ncbi:MAG TPA: universal stress protein [Hanamia sp.]|nr:universal stress protein [Hanamia sp.]
MKNILVPVDFSDASFNAVSYAAFLTNAFNARLTLVHAYTDTSAYDKSAGAKVYDSQEELEAANEKFLKKEIDGIARKFTVKTEGLVMKGKPVNVIYEVAEKINPGIIVMGMKGKGESNSRFGSTTTRMIAKTSIPLLIIPKNVSYKTVDTITLASDFNDEKLPFNFLILEELIKKFNPFIEILNVRGEKDPKLTAEVKLLAVIVAGKMSTDLAGDKYNYSFNIIEKDNIEEGINKFIKKHPTDLLIMVARKRNFINKVFEPSHSKKMTGLTKIPLLILHEESVLVSEDEMA